MSHERERTDDGNASESNGEGDVTRRNTLALLGAGGIGKYFADASNQTGTGANGAPGGRPWYDWSRDVDANDHDLFDLRSLDTHHVYTEARAPDVVVWRDEEGVFHADGHDGLVASGERVLAVTQAAVDSLDEGRTSKGKVLVASPGEVVEGDSPVELPSYTTLDVPVTLTVPDGEEAPRIVEATGERQIEVASLVVDGPARQGVKFTSCSNVYLRDLRVRGVRQQAVRIEGREDDPRSTDIQIDRVYLENTGHHGIETYGVDRIQIDQVIGVDPASCVVLLNDTTDATVNSIVGKEPGVPPGYATFRVANGAHDVTVGEVVSRGGARGVFGVSACSDITIGEVNIVGARDQGVLIQDCQNFTIQNGVVKNCESEGIRVDSRSSYDHPPAEGVSLSNLRVFDDREEKRQTYGIHETGPHTKNNRFVNNDLRDAGTEANLSVFAESTMAVENLAGGVETGTVTLTSGADPAARVTEVTTQKGASLSVRDKVFEGPDEPFSWTTYFEWTGSAWALVFEWRTDPGTDVEIDYIVDKPQANLGRKSGYPADAGPQSD